VVDLGFEHVGVGQSERLDHMFISTYREQTYRIDKAGYGLEIWLHGVVLLISKPSAHTGLTKPLDTPELPKPSNLFRPTTGGLE